METIKAISQYISQPVLYTGEKELGGQYYPNEKYELAGVRVHATAPFLLSIIGNYVSADKFKLILKPLSSITDEDVLSVYKLLDKKEGQAELKLEFYGKKPITETLMNIESNNWDFNVSNYIFQFLQSRGYDLPNWYLGGKTLYQSNLAIYE